MFVVHCLCLALCSLGKAFAFVKRLGEKMSNLDPNLKNLLDRSMELFNQSGELLCRLAEKDASELSATLGDICAMDIVKYLMYLSASDGTINWDEAQFIFDYLGYRLTPSQMNQFIRDQNIYSTEFEQTPPGGLRLLVDVDNTIITKFGENAGIDKYASESYLDLFRFIGQAFMAADNDVDENEKTDYTIYTNMIERFLDENLLSRKSGVDAIAKDIGSSGIQQKNGVIAPKKR